MRTLYDDMRSTTSGDYFDPPEERLVTLAAGDTRCGRAGQSSDHVSPVWGDRKAPKRLVVLEQRPLRAVSDVHDGQAGAAPVREEGVTGQDLIRALKHAHAGGLTRLPGCISRRRRSCVDDLTVGHPLGGHRRLPRERSPDRARLSSIGTPDGELSPAGSLEEERQA